MEMMKTLALHIPEQNVSDIKFLLYFKQNID